MTVVNCEVPSLLKVEGFSGIPPQSTRSHDSLRLGNKQQHHKHLLLESDYVCVSSAFAIAASLQDCEII